VSICPCLARLENSEGQIASLETRVRLSSINLLDKIVLKSARAGYFFIVIRRLVDNAQLVAIGPYHIAVGDNVSYPEGRLV
jgi:hypothetical protein